MSNFSSSSSSSNIISNVLTIKSVQIQPIKNVFTALKDILVDVPMTFTKKGIFISNFDKSHTILVNIELLAPNFEFYHCGPEKIIACANSSQLYKVISIMSNDDSLTMYIDECDYDSGIVANLSLQHENGEIQQCTTQKLRLIDPEDEQVRQCCFLCKNSVLFVSAVKCAACSLLVHY